MAQAWSCEHCGYTRFGPPPGRQCPDCGRAERAPPGPDHVLAHLERDARYLESEMAGVIRNFRAHDQRLSNLRRQYRMMLGEMKERESEFLDQVRQLAGRVKELQKFEREYMAFRATGKMRSAMAQELIGTGFVDFIETLEKAQNQELLRRGLGMEPLELIDHAPEEE